MNIAVVDIGGTFIKAGIWNGRRITNVKEIETNARLGGDTVIQNAINILKTFDNFERIGISSAGQIDSLNGVVKYANPNIPNYTGQDIKGKMKKEFNVPVIVENDVNAAAIGEWMYGAAKGYTDFLCLTYGTGIGGAIFIESQLYHGSGFSAGEFGNTITHANKKTSKDVMSGCYETYASVTALVKKALLYDKELDSGRKIFANINDNEVKQIVDEWVMEIVYGLINFIYIFNPSLIVLGGGIMNQDYIIDKINEHIYKNTMESYHNVMIKKALHGNEAGMLGVSWLAQTKL